MTYIKRAIEKELKQAAKDYPIVTITGPRQSGKTTLIRKIFPKKPYINLEDPDLRRLVIEDPRGFLDEYPDGAILDEIQRTPELPSYIQGIIDSMPKKKGVFILSGSQQFEMMTSITQSLAGRTAILTLLPLTMEELKPTQHSIDKLMINGFYPRIYADKINATKNYKNYYKTYIERDLRQLINIKDIHAFETFIRLCASRVGQIIVASQLSSAVGVSVTTIQSWLSILEASYIITLLQPYSANISKRLSKSPKLYFIDVGLAAYLLNIHSVDHIKRDPLRGHLFENLAIMELIKSATNIGEDHHLYFYQDQHKNEIDILKQVGNTLIPIEIKSSKTYHSDFLKNINYLQKLFPKKIKQSYLIYNGNTEQTIKNCKLINISNIGQI